MQAYIVQSVTYDTHSAAPVGGLTMLQCIEQMPRRSDARDRMIHSGVELFRERGVHGTAFADVLERSGSPRGSVYHHFPDGKDQFAAEVTQAAGAIGTAGLEAILKDHDPVQTMSLFAAAWRGVLVDSDFAAGCPIAAAAVEGDRSPAARDAAAATFADWHRLLAGALSARGVPAVRAASLTTLAIAAVEGAVVLCRAQRSLTPLEQTFAELDRLLRDALDGSASDSA
jgi:TetR/AcrR family transcriptional repressor of lmrAB and yxaGH operons